MKLDSPQLAAALFLLCFCISFAYAQTNVKTNPYTVGEVLTYEGKFNKLIFRGADVADITFAVSNVPNSRKYQVKAQASSKGTILKLIRKSFAQSIESTVDNESFSILKTVKREEEGDRVRDSEATFDYVNKKVTYVETDPKDLMRPPRRIASVIENGTYDLISGVYAIRRLPLAIGKTFILNVSDSGLVYKVPVRVIAREQQETILGKVICFRVVPEVFGEGRMIESDGSMTIWITDDNRRLPVRAQINTKIGRIEVKLRKAEIKKS